MRFEFCFPDDVATLVRRYAAVTALRIGWYYLIEFNTSLLPDRLLPSPLAILLDVVILIEGRVQYFLPLGIDLVLAIGQIGLLLGGVRLLRMRYRPRWFGEDPPESPLSPRPAKGIDSRRLQRSRWLPPVLMTASIALSCYLAVWLVLMLDRGRLLPMYWAFQTGGDWPFYIGLAFGVLGLFFGYRFSSAARAAVGGGFGIQYVPDDHALTRRVHALAEKLDLPPPQVGLIQAVNAFAIGRNRQDAAVALGVPLVNGLTQDELDAVIGHELGHIASADMQRMQFAAGYQRMFGATIRTATTIGGSVSQKRSTSLLVTALGALLQRTVMLGSELLMMLLSRTREFHADAVGAALTSPAAMIGALEKLHALPSTPTPAENRYGYLMARGHGRLGRLLSTHPTLEQRRKAIRGGGYIRLLPTR